MTELQTANPKSERREAARLIREAMPAELRAAASENICKRIVSMASFHLCDIILCYMPVGSEVDIRPVVSEALRLGKTVGLPVCDYAKGEMEFYAVNSLENLIPHGKMQIPEPAASEETRILPTNEAMILIPGLLFDKAGRRIGYGKGMYDKYIRRYPDLLRSSMTVGVNYAALFSDIPIPYTDMDVNLALVVTEKKVNFTRPIEKAPKREVRRRHYVPLIDADGNPIEKKKKDFYCANYVSPDEGKYKPPKAKDIIK